MQIILVDLIGLAGGVWACHFSRPIRAMLLFRTQKLCNLVAAMLRMVRIAFSSVVRLCLRRDVHSLMQLVHHRIILMLLAFFLILYACIGVRLFSHKCESFFLV